MSQMEPPYALGIPPHSPTPQMVMWQQSVIEAREKQIIELKARIAGLEELIRDSSQHDSWRCTEYQDCHCGLDDATDELGIPRIPYPPKARA